MSGRAAAVVLAALVACHPHAPAPARRTQWLVIAPHPDDEALFAAGVLRRAVEAGESVAVVIMTNGDYDCAIEGTARQAESLRGLGLLGVPAERVHFLGYPDAGLAQLGRMPLPPRKRKIGGTCTEGNTTYATRGLGRSGTSYTHESAVADLARILGELAPEDVAITHPADTHPDHAAIYFLFREALDRLPSAPRVHRALVHNGDCWPVSGDVDEPCPHTVIDSRLAMLPLSGRLRGYVPRERLPVPESCPKLQAIAAHSSQTRDSPESYLFAFARRDEPFFPETYERREGRWQRANLRPLASATATLPPTDSTVVLRAESYRLEIDPNAEARLYRGAARVAKWVLPHDLWRQGAEPFELRVDDVPADGAVEVSLRVRGVLASSAVVP